MLELVKITERPVEPGLQESIADQRRPHRARQVRPMTFRAIAIENDVSVCGLIRRVPAIAVGGTGRDAHCQPKSRQREHADHEAWPTSLRFAFWTHNLVSQKYPKDCGDGPHRRIEYKG